MPCIYVFIHAPANNVMLSYLYYDFYNIVFKIKHKLYIASGSAPPTGKFWTRAWTRMCLTAIMKRSESIQSRDDVKPFNKLRADFQVLAHIFNTGPLVTLKMQILPIFAAAQDYVSSPCQWYWKPCHATTIASTRWCHECQTRHAMYVKTQNWGAFA
jgi:hypothetical protein